MVLKQKKGNNLKSKNLYEDKILTEIAEVIDTPKAEFIAHTDILKFLKKYGS